MAETRLLDFTPSAETPTQLDIRVKNIGSGPLTNALVIELKLPKYIVSSAVADAVELAGQRNLDADCTVQMASLANLVTVPEGWSSWAADEITESVAIIRIFNDRDQKNHNQKVKPANFDAGAEFALHIPLALQEQPAHVEIPYAYRYANERSVDDKFEIATAGSRTRPPKVSLTTDQKSPTMIEPKSTVKIFWEVEKGVNATLYGPLPGGNSQMSLCSDPTANYKISNGSLEIYAVGPATYFLHAEVAGAEGQPNEIVIRTLSLDLFSPRQYAYLRVRPDRVLPNGVVAVDWAVWGIEQAFLDVGPVSLEFNLTEQNLSGAYQGTGVWRVNAPREKGTYLASLKVRGQKDGDEKVPNKVKHWDGFEKDSFEVKHWDALKDIKCTGNLIGLAVSGPMLALLTSDGLSIAVVGKDDQPYTLPIFTKKSTDTPKACLALAAFDDGFVVLQRTNNEGLRVSRYTQEGALQGLPIDLPDDVVPFVTGSEFDLATLGQRAYVVVVYTHASGKTQRFAYSVRFDPPEKPRVEPKLVGLSQFRLVTLDNALYALNRNTGQMLRFDHDKKVELAPACTAASAVWKGESMIREGLLVPAGRILLVLAPSATPPVDSLDLSGALHYNQTNAAEEDGVEITQDLVYNPQQDHWAPCGHGLEIEKGAVAAFRSGKSKRLWVVQPSRKMSTLSGAREDFFAPEYVESFSPKVLPPLLNRKREITILNQSGVDLLPVNDACRAADMDDITSDSLAELGSPPAAFLRDTQKKVTILYNQANPGTVRLHFVAAGPSSSTSPRLPTQHYLLEVTLSGAGLSNVSSVFKRLGVDGLVAELTKTRYKHPADGPVIVPQAAGLSEKLTLFIVNATTHNLNLFPSPGPSEVKESAKLTVTYNTPGFNISIPEIEKVGMSSINFDFALPKGIEFSAGNEAQRSLIRVNTDYIHMLDIRVQFLNAGSPPFEFEKYDLSKGQIPTQSEDAYVCLIGMRTQKELPGVRLGDPAVSPDARFLCVPLAKPGYSPNVYLWRMDVDTLAYAEFPFASNTGLLSVPNSVCASETFFFAMFSDKKLYRYNKFLQDSALVNSFAEYDEIIAMAATPDGDVVMVAKKNQNVQFERIPVYFLVIQKLSGSRSELKLDNIRYVSPGMIAVSQFKRLAICKDGGLLLVDLLSNLVNDIQIPKAQEPAYVTFSRDGNRVFCAHMTQMFSINPRQVLARNLTVTQIWATNLARGMPTTTLPNVDSNFALTGNTAQSLIVGVQLKEDVAFTMAPSPDDSELFVSAGTSIMKIERFPMTLSPWRATVDLPCRLITVTEGWGKAWTLYALGSRYTGNGTTVDDYKTHLYKLPVPKG